MSLNCLDLDMSFKVSREPEGLRASGPCFGLKDTDRSALLCYSCICRKKSSVFSLCRPTGDLALIGWMVGCRQ
jgi:hypothetical protein